MSSARSSVSSLAVLSVAWVKKAEAKTVMAPSATTRRREMIPISLRPMGMKRSRVFGLELSIMSHPLTILRLHPVLFSTRRDKNRDEAPFHPWGQDSSGSAGAAPQRP